MNITVACHVHQITLCSSDECAGILGDRWSIQMYVKVSSKMTLLTAGKMEYINLLRSIFTVVSQAVSFSPEELGSKQAFSYE